MTTRSRRQKTNRITMNIFVLDTDPSITVAFDLHWGDIENMENSGIRARSRHIKVSKAMNNHNSVCFNLIINTMDFSTINTAIAALISEHVYVTKKKVAGDLLEFVRTTDRLSPEEKFPVQMLLEEFAEKIEREAVPVATTKKTAKAKKSDADKEKDGSKEKEKEKKPRVSTKYNLWIKEAVAKMKVDRPDIAGSARLMVAARMYKEEMARDATAAAGGTASLTDPVVVGAGTQTNEHENTADLERDD
jgi:uncharacterized protein YdaU (DUF1376 family)